jgi:hypothetical protein
MSRSAEETRRGRACTLPLPSHALGLRSLRRFSRPHHRRLVYSSALQVFATLTVRLGAGDSAAVLSISFHCISERRWPTWQHDSEAAHRLAKICSPPFVNFQALFYLLAVPGSPRMIPRRSARSALSAFSRAAVHSKWGPRWRDLGPLLAATLARAPAGLNGRLFALQIETFATFLMQSSANELAVRDGPSGSG